MSRTRPLLRAVAFQTLRRRAAPAHLGCLYTLPDDAAALHPEKTAGRMGELPAHSRALLYRRLTLLLHRYLEKFAEFEGRREMLRELRNNQPGFLLTGRDGVGKSVLLSQCVHFARAAKILTLYIPDCHLHTHKRLYIEPNAILPGYFDTPRATEALFKGLRASQPDVLRGLRFAAPAPLPFDPAEEEEPRDLLQLVEWGLAKVDRLGILLKVFLDAIMELKDVPVLIALDGYNWFLHHTEYYFGEASLTSSAKDIPRVHADRLVVVRQLSRLLQRAKEADNVLFLAAVDTSNRHSQDTPFHPKLALLHPIEVPPYDDFELRTMLDYYLRQGPYSVHYTDPKSTVLPNLDRLCYKIGFLTNNTARGVWQQFVSLPNWTYP